ncbi:FecR domain-containing protein [Pigmentiphaga litoralis]|uniref:FecR domain-containing protein n=1 Tax=Pigmentiphaga litoralis TaxID=516702 RepID=UPI003B428E94
MNARTAFDTVFDTAQRLLILHEGEVVITTAPDISQPVRPFRVQTSEGRIRAIGTRFLVARADAWTDVGVFDGAVEVQTSAEEFRTRVISANQQLRMSMAGMSEPELLDGHAADWQFGILHADNMALGEFCTRLARYRRGWIRCDPAVADLLISGSFQVDDTDRALRALVATLPVRVTFHTRYWATLQPA